MSVERKWIRRSSPRRETLWNAASPTLGSRTEDHGTREYVQRQLQGLPAVQLPVLAARPPPAFVINHAKAVGAVIESVNAATEPQRSITDWQLERLFPAVTEAQLQLVVAVSSGVTKLNVKPGCQIVDDLAPIGKPEQRRPHHAHLLGLVEHALGNSCSSHGGIALKMDRDRLRAVRR